MATCITKSEVPKGQYAIAIRSFREEKIKKHGDIENGNSRASGNW